MTIPNLTSTDTELDEILRDQKMTRVGIVGVPPLQVINYLHERRA
jgi:hypothetical protein